MKIDLKRVPIAGEEEAEARAWSVVSRAHREQEPRPAPRRRVRPILVAAAAAAAAALVAVAVSPAGPDIVHSVRKAVGLKPALPALRALPAPGRLLVTSPEGPWVVQADGSKRLLGDYREASWSPHGLYVAVTRRTELLAVEPGGAVHWSVVRGRRPTLPRWAPDGYRIAYLEGSNLRIVNGDGTGDHLVAEAVAPVAAAWRPSDTHEHVLAFASRTGELELYNVDTKNLYARHNLRAVPRRLLWSGDGKRLVAVSGRTIFVFDHAGRPFGSIPLDRKAIDAAFEPGSHRLAVVLRGAKSAAMLFDVDRPILNPQVLFDGGLPLGGIAFSPDGRWLLLPAPTADLWFFVSAKAFPGSSASGSRHAQMRAVTSVSAVASQFDPRSKTPAFPRLEGWCC